MAALLDKENLDVSDDELEAEETRAAAIQEEEKRERELELVRLDMLGQSLAKTRSEAINARMTSGIEDEWLEDEEFYQGIDDANRAEAKSTWRVKPPGQATTQQAGTANTRSTVFPNITGPFVDAAAARIADMLLPTDDTNFKIAQTPIPELMAMSKGKMPPGMVREAAQMYPGQPELAKKRLAEAVSEAVRVIEEAKTRAEKAQKRIEDWHIECQWHAQIRQIIEDSARIGTGVLKGPIPVRKERVAWLEGRLVKRGEIKPGSKWIDPWNFYPDAACGEDIHNGSYTWERDFVTRAQLRKLRDDPNYIEEQIDLCLKEGPHKATAQFKPTPDSNVDNQQENKDKFEIWYFHGTAEREDLEAAGADIEDVEDPHMPAVITMVNNRVIKARLNPLDTGDFPYDVMVWRRRAGHWAGQGVARQIRTPQRIITAATRNLMDNAGIAAGPMLVFRQGKVFPADGGSPRIAPRLIYYIAEDADEIEDANKAIGTIKVDMVVDELLKIIQLGLNLAEHVTGLPMLLQGQMGKAPDTLGGMQMLNNNASAVLRRLARLFDDRITEPHVRRYYVYLLLDPKVPDDEKGDYCVDARGSSALVERDLQNQAIAQMGQMILDPRFGKDPKKWMNEFLKSQRLDVKRFDYDDEQWQQIVENMANGPQDPRMAVAQLNVEMKQRLTQLDQQWQARENERDRELQLVLKTLDSELDREAQTGAKVISLDRVKGLLAGKAMDIRSRNDEMAFAKKTGSGI